MQCILDLGWLLQYRYTSLHCKLVQVLYCWRLFYRYAVSSQSHPLGAATVHIYLPRNHR